MGYRWGRGSSTVRLPSLLPTVACAYFLITEMTQMYHLNHPDAGTLCPTVESVLQATERARKIVKRSALNMVPRFPTTMKHRISSPGSTSLAQTIVNNTWSEKAIEGWDATDLFLLYLVYPAVSLTILRLFSWLVRFPTCNYAYDLGDEDMRAGIAGWISSRVCATWTWVRIDPAYSCRTDEYLVRDPQKNAFQTHKTISSTEEVSIETPDPIPRKYNRTPSHSRSVYISTAQSFAEQKFGFRFNQ